jgi:uncharacterized protein (DUF433 family)
MTKRTYVEERDGRFYLAGSRVPVTALAALWREGASPEAMVEDYPLLSLATVYGGLAFYLEHRAEIDRQLAEDEADRYADLDRRFAALRARDAASAS